MQIWKYFFKFMICFISFYLLQISGPIRSSIKHRRMYWRFDWVNSFWYRIWSPWCFGRKICRNFESRPQFSSSRFSDGQSSGREVAFQRENQTVFGNDSTGDRTDRKVHWKSWDQVKTNIQLFNYSDLEFNYFHINLTIRKTVHNIETTGFE